MKSWPTFALAAVGLSYVLYFHLGLTAPRMEQTSASDAPEIERAAPAKPKPRPGAPERHWAFGGYPCSGNDCSEDKAGYRWAEEHHLTDPDDCTGKTGSFIEGCRVYARQQTR